MDTDESSWCTGWPTLNRLIDDDTGDVDGGSYCAAVHVVVVVASTPWLQSAILLVHRDTGCCTEVRG